LTGLSHGCPTQARVAAVGGDERTVAAGVSRAGQPGQRGPQPVVEPGPVDLPPVPADELWVKRVGRRVWRARAMAVPSRLGLGGGIRPHRARGWLTTLGPWVRSGGRRLARLVGVEGLASDVTAFWPVFRDPVPPGRRGRPRVVLATGWWVGHGGKRAVPRRGARVAHRGRRGTAAAIAAVRAGTPRGPGLNTADLARLNATCRASLAPRVRRGRALAHPERRLTAGMWRVGWADNGCGRPDRWRVRAPAGACWKWPERTPAMVTGLTHHGWTLDELWCDQGPLPPWVAPNRRGRPPTRALH
jgi:hypothetical protein